jgi:hypothetical protein
MFRGGVTKIKDRVYTCVTIIANMQTHTGATIKNLLYEKEFNKLRNQDVEPYCGSYHNAQTSF